MRNAKVSLTNIRNRLSHGDVSEQELDYMFTQAYRYIELCENGEPDNLVHLLSKNEVQSNQLNEIKYLISRFEQGQLSHVSVDYIMILLKEILGGEGIDSSAKNIG